MAVCRVTGLIACWLSFACGSRNILLIVVDDLRPTLGCYGDTLAITPNIDKLASGGITFNNAYAQQALCAPSRVSMLTSRRPDTTKLYDFHSYWRTAAGNFTTLPQHLKDNGYHCVSAGKVFHPGISSNFSDDMPYSWSRSPFHPSTQRYKSAAVCRDADGSLHQNLVCPVDVSSQPQGTLPDLQTSQFARRFLLSTADVSRTSRLPFFLAVGFHKPHIPFKYPRHYKDLYPIENIHLPPDRTRPSGLPLVAWNPWNDIRRRDDVKAINVSFPFGPMPGRFAREIIQNYYAATTYMDEQVGRVLDALKETGRDRDTAVVLVGDHGWSLGEHQEWAKYSLYEVAVRVPLIVRIPGVTDAGRARTRNRAGEKELRWKESEDEDGAGRDKHGDHDGKSVIRERGLSTDDLVELVDIFPTVAQLATLPTPEPCPADSSAVQLCSEGRSLVPLIDRLIMRRFPYANAKKLNSSYAQWKVGVFSQYPRPGVQPTAHPDSDQPRLSQIHVMGYSVRTQRFRYSEWVGFNHTTFTPDWGNVYGGELYDHGVDPREDHNLASDAAYVTAKTELKRLLKAGWRNATL